MSEELDRIKSLAGVESKEPVAEKVELNAAAQSGEETAKAGDVTQAMKMAKLKKAVEERDDDDTDFNGIFTGVAKGSISLDDKGKIAEASFGIIKDLDEACGKKHKKKLACEDEQLDEFNVNPFKQRNSARKQNRVDDMSPKAIANIIRQFEGSGKNAPRDIQAKYDELCDVGLLEQEINSDQGYEEAKQWIETSLKAGEYGPHDIGARPDEQLMSFDDLVYEIEAEGLMDYEDALGLIKDVYAEMEQAAYDYEQERGDWQHDVARDAEYDAVDSDFDHMGESAMFPKGSFERDIVEIIAEEMKSGKDAKTISEDLAFSFTEVETIYNILKKKVIEGYTVLPPMTDQEKERYIDREHQGLEGPFRLRSGKFVYYDKKAGKYYDSDTDLYMSDEDYFDHDKQSSLGETNAWLKGMQERPAKFKQMAQEFKSDPSAFAKWIAKMNVNGWLDGNMAELVSAGITWDDINAALEIPRKDGGKWVFPYVADKLHDQYGNS